MILALLGILAGWTVPAQEPADVPALEERIRTLISENLYDSAAETLKKFAAANPTLAGESRVQRQVAKVRDLAQEAGQLFDRRMAEARAHFDAEKFVKALEASGRALQLYPERNAQVTEFQARARDRMAKENMVRIPSQPTWIGSDDPADRRPFLNVTLPAFLIDKYPVTNAEYAAFVASTGAGAPASWWGGKVPKGRERHPVVMVTWEDAAAYAKWAGKRLPSAEEWEAAARGPDRREFPWGFEFQEKEDKFPCNCLEYWQVNKSLAPGTTPVDQFPIQAEKGAFGASMGGNVWEWTTTIVPGTVVGKPADFRILKGGSFMTVSRALRCASILPENPKLPHPDVGFRCAKDAP